MLTIEIQGLEMQTRSTAWFGSTITIGVLILSFNGGRLYGAQDTAPAAGKGSPKAAVSRKEVAPPKELVQYVLEATKLGLKDPQIHQNATKAGWPSAAVSQAIEYVRNLPPAADATGSGTPAAEPTKPPPDSSLLQASTRPEPAASVPAATLPQRAPEPATAAGIQAETGNSPEAYRIGAGDILKISVWKEAEASVPSAVVRPDGKITMPLIKEIDVIGLTPSEVEKLISQKLLAFIPEGPEVTVVVSGINSKRIYMIGAVKKEGPIQYTYRMTVMQALSEAGGLTEYAKRKKIYVLRTENGKEYRLPFDYDAVLKGERMDSNIPLLPNDTLVVPH
jgi:polysaccharide biosynthesis/export protein